MNFICYFCFKEKKRKRKQAGSFASSLSRFTLWVSSPLSRSPSSLLSSRPFPHLSLAVSHRTSLMIVPVPLAAIHHRDCSVSQRLDIATLYSLFDLAACLVLFSDFSECLIVLVLTQVGKEKEEGWRFLATSSSTQNWVLPF